MDKQTESREGFAQQNGMTMEFVDWFFDNKKDGCGNAWLIMAAAMWEGWKGRTQSLVVEPVNSPAIPDGWKLVPVEPTRQMMSQGHFAMGGTDRGKFRRIYQAMINASPTTEK